MKNAILLLGVTFVLGCGSDNKGNPMDAAMSMDFAMAHVDMAVNAKNGCNGFNTCVNNCADPTQGGPCYVACQNMATANSQTLFDNAIACGQDWCLATNDLGTGHCTLDGQNNLIDPVGQPSGTCNACLNDALAMLLPPPSTCMSPASPDCNPTACVAAQQACLADMP